MKHFLIVMFIVTLMSCTNNGPKIESPEDQVFAIQGAMAASHILVSHQDAQSSKETTRTREEALLKAQQLLERLREQPDLFPELAKDESDGPSAPRGGYLGGFDPGMMVPAFDAAVQNMSIGDLSAEPVETPFGFHIIRREPVEQRHYACEAFFVAFKGDERVPATVDRSMDAARMIAENIAADLTPQNFEELATANNDLGEGAMALEVMTEMDAGPLDVVNTLGRIGFGDVTGPVETPIGFAFMKRVRAVRYGGAHILISHRDADLGGQQPARSKEEALTLAQELSDTLQNEPDRFAELARTHSDGPSGARGGDLGVWFRGRMVKPFDDAVGAMAVGAITPTPVETPFGYHIILRKE